MTVAELLSFLRKSIGSVDGDLISKKSLQDLLEHLESRDHSDDLHLTYGDRLEAYSIQQEQWKFMIQQNNQSHQELNRFAVQTGQHSIRAAMIVNGGAALAALAFIGNTIEKLPPETVASMSTALWLFSLGVGCAAVAAGLTYLAQRFLVNNNSSRIDAEYVEARITAAKNALKSQTDKSVSEAISADERSAKNHRKNEKRWGDTARRINYASVGVVIVSYLTFGIGVYFAIDEFRKTAIPEAKVYGAEAGAEDEFAPIDLNGPIVAVARPRQVEEGEE